MKRERSSHDSCCCLLLVVSSPWNIATQRAGRDRVRGLGGDAGLQSMEKSSLTFMEE